MTRNLLVKMLLHAIGYSIKLIADKIYDCLEWDSIAIEWCYIHRYPPSSAQEAHFSVSQAVWNVVCVDS